MMIPSLMVLFLIVGYDDDGVLVVFGFVEEFYDIGGVAAFTTVLGY